MIERQGVDKLALMREFGFEMGELIEISREEVRETGEDVFVDEENSDWIGDLCDFFKELAQYTTIEGVAVSSEPNREVHIDYFCHGDNGKEMGNVISGIELARYFVGNPTGSIQWFGRDRTFEDTTRRFRSSITVGHDSRDLLMLVKFV